MNLKIEQTKREEGFTLIELLVVVIIIGILAAIAIPIFLNQRAQAWERTAQSDARNAAIALESYFNDEFEYPDDATAAGLVSGGTITPGNPAELTTGEQITASPQITMTYVLDEDAYAICVQHGNLDDGAGVVAVYDSGAGGIVQDVNRNETGDIGDCDPGNEW